MSRKRGGARKYYREGRGWYGDFRAYAAWGGGREALTPDGARRATDDERQADYLFAQRLHELEEMRAGRIPLPTKPVEIPTLSDYAERHFAMKELNRKESTVTRDKGALENVKEFLPDDVRLTAITVGDLNDYVEHRQRAGKAAQTIHHELNALSNLMARAYKEGRIPTNPVPLVEKPSIVRDEAVWLEVDEAARVLDTARLMDRKAKGRTIPFAHPILATALLTGGRASEVLGLLVADVDLENRLVHIRPNVYRSLKRAWHKRTIPLWPQLHGIVKKYVESRNPEGLLFPSPGKTDRMIGDLRKMINRAIGGAKIEDKHVTMHTFRHTYAATRMQTIDHGAPVSPYTVMSELGHSSLAQIIKTYGHLQSARQRLDVVEYKRTKVHDLDAARGKSA